MYCNLDKTGTGCGAVYRRGGRRSHWMCRFPHQVTMMGGVIPLMGRRRMIGAMLRDSGGAQEAEG